VTHRFMSRPLTKLFIRNFGKESNRRDVEDLFGKYGNIYDCKMNQQEGYAVVCYREYESADRAISELNGSMSLGGKLQVEHTLKKSRYDDGNSSRPPRDDRFGRDERYGGRD